MAVNGIKIELGQTWITRGGNKVVVRRFNKGTAFPWTVQYLDGGTVTLDHQGAATLGGEASSADLQTLTPTDQRVFGTVQGYERLFDVLSRAFAQAATGKGAARHVADGEPFHEQVMQIGAAKFGVGSLLFQAFKKSEESQRLPHDAAIKELLGAINYLAGAVIALEIAKDKKCD